MAGQSVTVKNDGTGAGTFNTAGITSYVIGQPVTFTGGTTFNPLPIQASVTTIALLRSYTVASPIVNGSAVQVTGYYAPNDGGGGLYVWNAASTTADNGGTVIQATGVATGRWLLQYASYVTAKQFGAKGDGVSDDRVALQAAMDFASTNSVPLVVPNGTYLVSMTNWGGTYGGVYSLKVSNNLTMYGQTAAGAVVKLKNSAFGGGSFHRIFMSDVAASVNNVTLSNFTVDGNSSNQVADTNGGNIILEICNQTTINGVRSINANGEGIQIRNAVGSNGSDDTITNCYVDNASYIGIQVAQFTRMSITNNVVKNCVDNGIDLYGENGTLTSSSGQFLISGNRIYNCSVGIFHETIRDGVTSGNAIDSCTAFGLTVNRINGTPKNIRIQDNLITGTPAGIRITGDTSGIQIQSNTFAGFTVDAVELGGNSAGLANCSYILVKGNYFYPSTNTVPIVQTGGNQVAFCVVQENVVNSSEMDPALLYVTHATTHVANQIFEWFGQTGTMGPDLARTNGTVTTLASTTLTVPAIETLATINASHVTQKLTVYGPLKVNTGNFGALSGVYHIPMTGHTAGYILLASDGAGSHQVGLYKYSNAGGTLVVSAAGTDATNPGAIFTVGASGTDITVDFGAFTNMFLTWAIYDGGTY